MNNNETPLVSVIIPTFNRVKLVPRAIKSILGQSYANFECIVVDDASTDDTKKVVNSIKDERIIYLLHQENRHASAARNTGIKIARGEFIAFLDDDDEWLPEKLEKQVSLMLKLPNKVGMVYCWMDYYSNGKLINEHHPIIKGNVFCSVLDKQRIGGCPTLLVRKEVFKYVIGFDESLKQGNDGDFIRRVCKKYEVDFIPGVFVKVHTNHGFERISIKLDTDGIKSAILSYEDRINKFEEELKQYPKKLSNIYFSLCKYYFLLPRYNKFILYILKGIKVRLKGKNFENIQ